MVGYMFLGAWLLTLIILGIIVISTGIPYEESDDGSMTFIVWFAKMFYLLLLASTMYELGAHFANQ